MASQGSDHDKVTDSLRFSSGSGHDDNDPLGASYTGSRLEITSLAQNGKKTSKNFAATRGSLPRGVSSRRRMDRTNSVMAMMAEEQEKKLNAGIAKLIHFEKYQIIFFLLPMFISLWYSVAVLFPPSAREGKYWSLLLWSEGLLVTKNGTPEICPRPSICSQGVFQIILISISRLTAFASYVTMGITFVTKMHSTIHILSKSYLSVYIPFQSFHDVHKHLGFSYAMLALLHTIGHIIRWSIRKEMGSRSATQVGVSGYIAIVAMIVIVFAMSPYAKKFDYMTFERRLGLHWLYTLLIAALCFHTERCMAISICFGGLWALDYAYGRIYRTHRLEVVEFTALPEMAGCQMLWRNPEGFKAKSGEFVKVRLPWMEENGKEWHPFSLYLREATKEGLEEIAKETEELKNVLNRERRRSQLERKGDLFGTQAVEGVEIDPYKSALLLFGLQNEFISPEGQLHNNVKSVMQNNKMTEALSRLIEAAREECVQIIHLPIIIQSDDLASKSRLTAKYKSQSLFIEGTWNAEFADQFQPKPGDLVIRNRTADDFFEDTDLEPFIKRNNIDTLVFAGFTLDGFLEATMFKANDLGLRVISLSDGTASRDLSEHISTCESLFELFGPVLSCAVTQKIIEGEVPEYSSARRSSMEHIKKQESKYFEQQEQTLHQFLIKHLYSPVAEEEEEEEETLIMKEAREDLSKRFETSQIFICPEGDWTKKINLAVRERSQQRACWISGPYTSPYFVATKFRHIILTASGIGITPALGVMGQYPGNTKTKVLVWMTRSKVMLKFFAPLMKDCHVAVVYYTGKEKLTSMELKNIDRQGRGNIFIQQKRPKSLAESLETIVIQFENSFEEACDTDVKHHTLKTIEQRHLQSWCLLYCGGSVTVETILKKFANEHKFGWDSEFFNW